MSLQAQQKPDNTCSRDIKQRRKEALDVSDQMR
jgi:hypothetical protein